MVAPRVPSFDELMWPTILALKASGGSASNDELLVGVIEIARVADEVAALPHKDGRQSRLNYNLAWARTYLKKAGFVANSQRGVWSLTEMGEAATEDGLRSVAADVRAMVAADAGRTSAAHDAGASDRAPAPEAAWNERLLGILKELAPDAFERLAQRLLREAGFIKVEVTGRSGDGGIDGLGVLRINLLSFTTLFQCKRYAGSVGPAVVRDFRGAMIGRGDKGLVITTGTFSADARREATRDGAPAIDLIDGERLCELLRELRLGVSTRVVEEVVVDQHWFGQL